MKKYYKVMKSLQTCVMDHRKLRFCSCTGIQAVLFSLSSDDNCDQINKRADAVFGKEMRSEALCFGQLQIHTSLHQQANT